MAAGDGLVSMTPTSIAHSGTSASINADGGVDFTAVTSLSLNGVFTSDYDNYLIVITGTASAGVYVRLKLRELGTDTTGSNYVSQSLAAGGSSIAGGRSAASSNSTFCYQTTIANVVHLHVYGPSLAQPTALRSVTGLDENGAYIEDLAITHSLSTSYDGITFLTGSATTLTGNVHVFGYEE